MANKAISDIFASDPVVTPAATDQFEVNQGGTTRAETRAQIHELQSGETFTGENAAAPAIVDEAASATNPTLMPDKSDLDTGLGHAAADALSLVAGGVEGMRLTEAGAAVAVTVIGDTEVTGDLTASDAAGPAVQDEAASATNPTLIPDKTDLDTGVGHQGADNLSLVAGGAEAIRAEDPADLGATETSLWLYDLDNGAIQQVTVGAADSGGAGFKVLRIVN